MIKRLFSIDVRTLAFFRIGLGVLILSDLIAKSTNIVAFYTDKGILPRSVYLSEFAGNYAWSFHLMNGSFGWQVLLFIIAALFSLLLIFGYKTRLVTVASFVLLVSIQFRNPMILYGGDALLRLLTFWAMFLPLGAIYSIDSALQKKRHDIKSIFSWSSAAILIQIGIMYWFTTILKTGYAWIPDGTAVYYALMVEQLVTPFGLWLRQFPVLMKEMTYLVFALEFFAIFLLFPPFATRKIRSIGIFLLVMMHIGMGISMTLIFFSFVVILGLLLFTPSFWWDYLQKKLSRESSEQLRLYYDADCGFCKKAVRIIVTFLALPFEIIKTGQSEGHINALMKQNNSWVVVAPTGEITYEFEAFITMCKYSPIFFWVVPILSIKFVKRMLNCVYSFVRSHRPWLSKFTTKFLPYRDIKITLGGLGSSIVFVSLFLVIIWNGAGLLNKVDKIPVPIKKAIFTIHLDQKWEMFAPYPRTGDGWYIIDGELNDGTRVDVFHKTISEVSDDKPELVSREYKNRYWRKYMMTLSSQKYKKRRLYYGKYLCRDWNKNVEDDKKLSKFTIYFMQTITQENYKIKGPVKRELWKHTCF